MPDEARAIVHVAQRMARRGCRAGRFVQTQQQAHGRHRQHRRQHESRRRTGPRDQRACERGPGREGGTARQLQPPVGARQRVTRHEGRHQRGRRDAEAHGADRAEEPEHGQPADAQRRRQHHAEQGQQRHGAQPLGPHHQATARHAVREQAHRQRDQQEGQRLHRRQKADLARPGAEREHGHQRHGREAQLFGGLRRKIGPGKVGEGTGKRRGHGRHTKRKTASSGPRPSAAGRLRTWKPQPAFICSNHSATHTASGAASGARP
ncbi:hypothetical protein D3C87_1086950 [compost metagenome]